MKHSKIIKSYLMMTIGCFIMATGIYFFKFPNNFATGGVSNLAIILNSVFPDFTAGQYMMAANLVLLVIGFCVFGRGFAFKTVFCSAVLSGFT